MDGDQCIWGNIFDLEGEERKKEKEKEREEKGIRSRIVSCLQVHVRGRQGSPMHF